MRKTSLLSLALSCCLLLQSFSLPVFADEEPETTEETLILPTVSQEAPPVETDFKAPSDLAFGTVSIYNGCRGLNGMMPLDNGRILESAQGAMVYERNTDTVVYSFAPDQKLSPGTLTKIVTALVVVESTELDAKVTCHSRNISRLPGGSQNAKLKEGEILTVNDLLHTMILHGANDAAIALAEFVSGNQESFVGLMNARVKKMGCTATKFGNVHGLDTVDQFTTTRDMTKIMVEATKNEIIRDLLFTRKYKVPETNRSKARAFDCQNYLISEAVTPKFYQEEVTGGLASYTQQAGASLACTAKYGDLDYVLVVMGATRLFEPDKAWKASYYGNFDEMVKLLDYASAGYRIKRIVYEGQALNQFKVIDGENDVVGAPQVNIDTVLPKGVSMDNLRLELKPVGGGLTAPIKKGQMISTAELWYRTSCLAEAELYAMSDVRYVEKEAPQIKERNDSDTSGFVSFVKIVSALVLIPVAGYLVINNLLRLRMRHKKRKKKGSRRPEWMEDDEPERRRPRRKAPRSSRDGRRPERRRR